ncbi:TetR/AcrR family transcriptional regulator [Bifidobacterium scardovii]|uniref:AcrR family transcriptional regulator n=1 Tax=Bifidobacterium scardovii TaxID=158787 RepID=A0A087DJ72_9BIFI|nr:TetR/AcrR family transcriptional regulator [Bifidobacterium scardovii]KFI95572.1 AcrR family transcriptional regulator [Bifidobacterium scardovii]MDK6348416.1 TetR/AcrR family transcriptional regulator [Bifidobacterium scardovii]MDU8982676.1 TetR/AcrR family transcriptional regulator [Bifidobacterium scardovii]BAQ32417.1 transcriptional regulator [Bifidobacterium scardovii JCM 12489 = DSM 13734]
MTDTSSAADARRAQIVRAARETCLDTGFSKLTISGIAERAGMTRSLFYHYFPDKNAVADAVINDTINDMLAKLERWNATREAGNIDKALGDIVRLTRAIIADEGPFSARLMQAGNAELYIRFIDRIADRIADYICNTTALDFERMHGLPIHSVHETMYVLIVGLISMIRLHPDTPDNVIKRVAAQILHIEEYVK